MPTARAFFTTSVVGGRIYAIGGAMDTNGPAVKTVEEYDPAMNAWTPKADLPEARYLHGAAVAGGKIYIQAGSWKAWTASRALFVYDPASDAWERKAAAPTARSWVCAAEANGKVYVFGGDFGPPKATVEEYDPVTNTWTSLPNMPYARGAMAAATLDSTIYVLGGTISLMSDTQSTAVAFVPNPAVGYFQRGESNSDSNLDISDAVFTLAFLFTGGPTPPCLDAADTNDDGAVDLSDGVYLLQHLFIDGSTLPPPYPGCGIDPTADADGADLGCERYQPCE
jgi:hypothetical protein